VTHNRLVADLFLARRMLREGADLQEIADVLDTDRAKVDLMLWRWFGASAGLPTPKKRAQVAA
jgi:hypothetical protein